MKERDPRWNVVIMSGMYLFKFHKSVAFLGI